MKPIGHDLEATRKLAEFAAGVRYEDLPEKIAEQAKKLTLDALGVGLLGTMTDAGPRIQQVMSSIGAADDASIWGTPRRASAYVASMINSSCVHQTELGEGVSRAVVHASTVVVPAALAVAEREHASGKDLIRAVALGCEVLIRWGYTMQSDPARPESERLKGDSAVAMNHGWKTPAMLAPIGAGTSAAVLIGRPDLLQQTWHFAVNVCPATSFAIIREGASGKGSFLGIGTASGVLAADLTRAGLIGIQDVFKDWMGQIIPTFDPKRMTAELGQNWELSFVLYKHFATIGPLFAALEATFGILEKAPDLDNAQIEQIEIEGYARSIDIPQYGPPQSEEGARHNLTYCVAEVLMRRRREVFFLDAFREEEYRNPETLKLAAKVKGKVNPDYNALYPHHAAKALARIRLRNGTVLEHEVDRDAISRYHYPTWEELTQKFVHASTGRLTEKSALRVANAARSIENIKDIREFTALLQQ